MHEAGHGVMNHLVGYRTRYLTNIADASSLGRMYGTLERCPPFRIVRGVATSEERARALVNVAGVAAVCTLLGEPAQLLGLDADRANAYGRTIAADGAAVVRQLLIDAESLFATEHVRNVTVAIAHRLARDHVVLGSDIQTLLEGVGLERDETTTSGVPVQRVATSIPRSTIQHGGRGLLGDEAFVDATSPRYFFINSRSK